VVADTTGRAVAFALAPGQAHEPPSAPGLLDWSTSAHHRRAGQAMGYRDICPLVRSMSGQAGAAHR
jgi:hypothetical protein